MKCPNCGKRIADDKLFCEFCGEEINIVPDYDPKSDLSINLDGVFDKTKELNVNEVKQKKKIQSSSTARKVKKAEYFDDDDYDNDESFGLSDIKDIFMYIIDFWQKGIVPKIMVIFAFVIIIFAVFGVINVVSKVVGKHSFEYYVEQGDEYVNKGDFEAAIECYEDALKKDASSVSVKYKISDAYKADNQINNAVFILKEIADENPSIEEEAYDKIFDILYEAEDWAGINTILDSCENPKIVEKFKQYLCRKPAFSYESGTYEDVIYLELSASSNGFIYYTFDGSDPTETSNLYSEPIMLDLGEYDIKAVFISEFGVISEINEANYVIDKNAPLAPMVSIEGGSYNVPILISVVSDVDCTTYYNIKRPTDKDELSDPDMDSIEYNGPIPMPLGASELRFISYNSEGVASSVITRKYNVTIDESVVSRAQAANKATEFRFSQGGLLDTEGHSATGSGRFLYIIEDAINMKGTVYYVINEYYEDNNVNKTSFTGKRIAVNSQNIDDFGWLELNATGDYYISRPY